MDNLEPITREEMLLDGQDLEPITRKEMFIKRIYDKTQVVPKPITREEMFLNKAGEGGGGDITIEQLNVTQNGTYSESGKAYSPVVVNVPAPPIPENAYLLNSLSGLPADIASFTDGTDLPMASLKVAVTPYQDLHGYDGPWAGGAGKNKFDDTAIIKGLYSDENFTVIQDTSALYRSYKTYLKAGTYTFSSSKELRIMRSVMDGVYSSSQSDLPYTFTTATDGYVGFSFRNKDDSDWLNTTKCQIELGQTATSIAPYSNICPIIGWDEAVVTRCGKNLYKSKNTGRTNNDITYTLDNGEVVANGTASTTSYYMSSSEVIKVINGTKLPKGTYTLGKTGFSGVEYMVVNTNNVVIGTATDTQPLTFTLSENTTIVVNIRVYSNTTLSNQKLTMQIEEGTTATTYTPYNSATYTIDLNGTRYGGTLDATDGTFLDMIDHIASYNGEELPSAWISDRDVYTVGTTPTIGAEVVYPRATPITVQLSPTQVKSLEGVNNINANCGDIIELKYFSKEV